MTQIKDHLTRFSACGFTCLPLDQATEACWRSGYIVAFKLIFDKEVTDEVIGLQLITGGLKQESVFFPEDFCQGPAPDFRLGFCGQTLFINDKAFLLNDLRDLDSDGRMVK